MLDLYTGTLVIVIACLKLPEHRRIVGFEKVSVLSRSAAVVCENIRKASAESVSKGMPAFESKRRVESWIIPTGLAPMQTFPIHVTHRLGYLYKDATLFKRFRHIFFCNDLISVEGVLPHGCGSASSPWHISSKSHGEKVGNFTSWIWAGVVCYLNNWQKWVYDITVALWYVHIWSRNGTWQRRTVKECCTWLTNVLWCGRAGYLRGWRTRTGLSIKCRLSQHCFRPCRISTMPATCLKTLL